MLGFRLGRPNSQLIFFDISPFPVHQVINTVYRLAEQPDDICGELLKALAEPVLGPAAPATGASVLLERLLFVVGHVALKQLVHLDIIEAELAEPAAPPSSNTAISHDDDNLSGMIEASTDSDPLADYLDRAEVMQTIPAALFNTDTALNFIEATLEIDVVECLNRLCDSRP